MHHLLILYQILHLLPLLPTLLLLHLPLTLHLHHSFLLTQILFLFLLLLSLYRPLPLHHLLPGLPQVVLQMFHFPLVFLALSSTLLHLQHQLLVLALVLVCSRLRLKTYRAEAVICAGHSATGIRAPRPQLCRGVLWKATLWEVERTSIQS